MRFDEYEAEILLIALLYMKQDLLTDMELVKTEKDEKLLADLNFLITRILGTYPKIEIHCKRRLESYENN